jgi:hypothetical protein
MYKFIQCLMLALPIVSYAEMDQETLGERRMVRHKEIHKVKSEVMKFCDNKSIPDQLMNGDDTKYDDLRSCYGKALKHEPSGFINKQAYQSLANALMSGKSDKFEMIMLGTGIKKLANPQGSYPFSLAANDGWINTIRPAPQYDSAESAGEMVELYWSALVRDTPFNAFDRDPTVASAVRELNNLSDFRGPKIKGNVTTATFLRGITPGDLIGPYISQFHYQPIPLGIFMQNPEQLVPVAGKENNFLTTFNDWYTVANGGLTGKETKLEGDKHFIRTPRDLTEFVHRDYPGQVFFNAMFLINSYGSKALDPANPYMSSDTQRGFVSYGLPHVLEMLAESIEESLKASWYQKWQVNRRLRPEEYGFYLQKQVMDNQPLGIHEELTNSMVLDKIKGLYGSYFLPQAYPEGSPTHPSYPAGHATVAGACVTILKAFFNEDFLVQNPIEPNIKNNRLIAYKGSLTVGDELNKLAANEALGRDHAGVHYRSDSTEGLLLGEKVAIDILENNGFLNAENFSGFSFTKFDGTKITVGGNHE